MPSVSTSLHAYIRGSRNDVDNRHAYIRGALHPFTSLHAYMLGMPKTTLHAYIKGASPARATNVGLTVESMPEYKQRLSNIAVQVETLPTYKQRLSNVVVQVEFIDERRTSQHAFIQGAAAFEIEWTQVRLPPLLGYYASGEQAAYIKGGVALSTVEHAYIRGKIVDVRASQHAMIVATVPISTSLHAYITGIGHVSTVQHAMINSGPASILTSQHAYIFGNPGTRQHAFIHGGGLARVTSVATNIEWRYPATERVTAIGTSLEWRYPYWLRTTAAGLTIEWVYGASIIYKVTAAAVMVEWSSIEDEFGPNLWMIG